MLRLSAPAANVDNRFCDRLSRRRFIEIGSLGVLGLSLPDLLRAKMEGRDTGKSVILVWQHGGPSQLDTFDMKPDQQLEVRGPFKSIPTSLPGLRICEKLPYQARVMDKCTVIRSFSHHIAGHFIASHYLLTGYPNRGSSRTPMNPSMGSVTSSLLGPKDQGVPAYVNMNDGGFGFHGASFLGVTHNPFRTGNYSYGNEGVQLPSARDSSFNLVDGLSETRLMDRVALLGQFDTLRRRLEHQEEFRSVDAMNRQALDIIVSGRARKAFDISEEDPRVREHYGTGWGEQALLARRLIQAGVRFVTLNTGYWDDHGNILGALNSKLPRHDRAVGVLIQDLHDRGMLEDTLVVTAGEFGRTPKINKNKGRDHWPQAQSILFAGGGYRHGQVIGATNSKAEHPTSRPVGPGDFQAIIYNALGLALDDTVTNLTGRPIHLAPGGKVPHEMA